MQGSTCRGTDRGAGVPVRLAANLDFLFRDLPLLDRFAAARAAGFAGVELPFPYDDPIPEMVDALSRHGLAVAVITMPPPNRTGGPRGFAAVPGGETRFRSDFARALRFVRRLKAQALHVMAGRAEGPAARATFAANLRWAAAQAPDLTVLVGPLRPEEVPGYFLTDADLATDVLAEVGAPNLRLQFDTWQMAGDAGDPVVALRRLAPLVGHVQLAGPRRRQEPEGFDLAAFAAVLRAAGYTGWIGAEYHPAVATEDGLGWMSAFA